jgi:hypothetical protein
MLIAARSSEGLCLLLTCNRERSFEMRFRFRRIRLARQQHNFPGHAMDVGVAPAFLGCLARCDRFADVSAYPRSRQGTGQLSAALASIDLPSCFWLGHQGFK